jgi:hypothetical protein
MLARNPPPAVSLTTSTRWWCTCATLAPPRALAVNQPARTLARRGPPAHQGDGRHPRRNQLPVTRLGGARPVFSHASNGATFTDVDRQHLYLHIPASRLRYSRRGGRRRISLPRASRPIRAGHEGFCSRRKPVASSVAWRSTQTHRPARAKPRASPNSRPRPPSTDVTSTSSSASEIRARAQRSPPRAHHRGLIPTQPSMPPSTHHPRPAARQARSRPLLPLRAVRRLPPPGRRDSVDRRRAMSMTSAPEPPTPLRVPKQANLRVNQATSDHRIPSNEGHSTRLQALTIRHAQVRVLPGPLGITW